MRLAIVLVLLSGFCWAQQPIAVTDGSNGNVAVKPAATQPALVDKSQVVGISPNNGGLPVNLLAQVQKHAAASSGSVASLANAFSSNVTAGNSLVVSFCFGNGNTPTSPITNTLNSTWNKAVHSGNAAGGQNIGCEIWYAVGVSGGADTVTVTPGGTNGSIASEVYEYSGAIAQIPAQGDVTTSALSGSSGTAVTAPAVSPMGPNAVMIANVGVVLSTATITPGTNWTNDSGQQNPATPTGLDSFVSMSQQLDDLQSIAPTATLGTSQAWVTTAAIFHSPILPVGGVMRLTDGTTNAGVLSNGAVKSGMMYPDTVSTSYHASKKFAASSTTDNAVLPGNATNTILVTRVLVTCTQTTAGNINVELVKRSAADSGGTSAAITAIPDDANYAAAVSAPLSYTGTGPSAGAAVGDLDNAQIGCMASATATPNDIYIFKPLKPIVLRGVAQEIVVNVGNAALTGGNLTVTFEWIETTTP